MDSSLPKKEIAVDPFAADIFAATRAEEDKISETTAETEAEKSSFWFKQLPQVARSIADWDELWRNLSPIFFDELPRRLTESLVPFLISPDEKKIEFLFSVKREINRTENLGSLDSWWLTVGVEAIEAEITFEIARAFAVWLIDATLGEKNPGTGGAVFREITPSEMAILEFLSLNLTHEANLILQSPIFKFRALSRTIPASLRRNLESEKPALLVVNWQTVHGLLPSIVKMYLAPEVLHALQPGENRLLKSASSRAVRRSLPNPIKDVRMRLLLGDAELSYGELAAIETGDVVLFENHALTISGANVLGHAEILLGSGENLKIVGELASDDFPASVPIEEIGASGDNKIPIRKLNSKSAWRMTIENFAETEMPSMPENFMAETNENLTNEPTAENADEQSGLAVENLAVNLRVELEARRMSLAEIGNLRENQILELGISPTDTVNLLIDNQTIGRGELVAVHDRLGVRITKLLR